jgi:hypothetical protein
MARKFWQEGCMDVLNCGIIWKWCLFVIEVDSRRYISKPFISAAIFAKAHIMQAMTKQIRASSSKF